MKRTAQPVKIDGDMNDIAWAEAEPAGNFWQNFPFDTLPAGQQTEIYMAYDDTYLYVATKCYSVGDDYVVPSLRRDYSAGGSDNITLLFDPFTDRTNAFVFGLNPYGVLREALISNGGAQNSRDWDESWDSKWFGAAKIHEGYWLAEFAIPFTTLRFKEGSQKWYFNSYRFDTQNNENSSLTHIPRNQIIINLAYMTPMEWEEPLKKSGSNVSLIPFITGATTRDFEENPTQSDGNFNIGGDAKIAVTSGLNLDLTINPDFSQVEVDQQVTNLDRFEIFFPERRQFFLENADLFGSFGTRNINPFFSRRIGIVEDTAAERNIENTIFYGARLSGKLDNNWRLGVLNMQTAKDQQNGLPGFNYTVTALQRKLFSRSNLGLIFVNRQAIDKDSTDLFNPYNRIIGLDYNLASSDNRWTGKFFFHKSFTPGISSQDWAYGTQLEYNVRLFRLRWRHDHVADDYNAEAGFVRRTNIIRMQPQARLQFYPTTGPVNQHGPGIETDITVRPDSGRIDHALEFNWFISFRNRSRLTFRLQNSFTRLLDEFDPTRTDATPLPSFTEYNYTGVRIDYNSDRRKAFAFSLRPYFGQFFNGRRINLAGNFSYRLQPFGSIALNYSYNRISLPEPYATASLFLIGPRFDITFTRNLFLTTFIQYNNQIDNININARFQWRFQPVSDFFLVYTDNYTTDFNVKNRAIVAKLTYWLNL
ncbi:MAG: DUF5916 domain-containing protein [Bacteroidota bacterium]